MSLSKLLGKIDTPQQKKKPEVVVPLIREVEKEIPKDKRIVIKLRSTPTDANSQLYEVVTRAFDHGTPEEWIRHLKMIRRILVGQNITTGPDSFRMTRRLLEGKALADFNASVTTNGYNETVQNLNLVLNDVAVPIFPTRALQKQRRSMRRKMPKPFGMPVSHYWARLVELNEYLLLFPGADENSRIDDDDLKEILEFGIPETWRMYMTITRFISANETPASIVNFCRDLEGIEAEHGSLDVIGVFKDKPKKKVKSSRKQDSPVSQPRKNLKRSRDTFEDSAKCPIHPGANHTAAECDVMKKLISTEREKYVKKRKTQGAADKKLKTSEEQLHVMIEDYLHSRICPKRKKLIKRSVKWDKSLKESCSGPGAPKLGKRISGPTPKASRKSALKSKTVDDELAEFNNFTVKDTTSKEESDYRKMVNSDEETTATGSISGDSD